MAPRSSLPALVAALAVASGCKLPEIDLDPDACRASPSDPRSDALVDAAVAGDGAAVDRALAAGADPRYVDGRENEVLELVTCPTALQRAAARGHVDITRKLLAAGADPAHRGYAGWTPLHYAAQGRHLDCVKLLVDAKAPVNARTSLGYTPLTEAVAVGSTEVVKALLANGADPDLADGKGRTPRDIAQERGPEMKALLPPR